ncbi:hypothetical protein V495_05833 [Pseudogymnoascus sp. VKM F-4514 (FW-929)]|nr:hypothetical protein V495_05833 [Pseudogymnoascus sp. VKM F-4514 (FW-929)]KFY62387.1 hypothetical protein V497_02379 [Pseudogymnoascus sp. VKM F-4516 (FW-969)]
MADLTPRRSSRLQGKSTLSRSTSSTSGNSTGAPTPSRSSSSASPTPSATIATESYAVAKPTRSPYLPTYAESLLLALYPATLVFGSIFGLIDPATRASPYLDTHQSHDPALAPSYFAKKSNLVNVLFVKRGWFWVTVSYFLFLFTNAAIGARGSDALARKRIQGTLRWGIVTLWWVFVTQWFFGPAIIDRGFLLTGGACELKDMIDRGDAKADRAERFLTSMACKARGGTWSGGHDISGHVFLLVLGSMFLFQEVLHVALRAAKGREERVVLLQNGEVKSADSESEAERADTQNVITASPWDFGLTGLLVAFSGVFVVYFLPRFVPSWRAIIGMPGV